MRPGVGRRVQAAADGDDPAVAHQHVGVVQTGAGAGQHGRAADQHRRRGDRAIGAGVGIEGEARDGLGGGPGRIGGAGRRQNERGQHGRDKRGEKGAVHDGSPARRCSDEPTP
jgi:hypothetical protein